MNSVGDATRGASSVKSRFKSALRWLSGISRVLALLVLLIYLPVIVAVGLLVLLSSPGPAFVKKAYKRANGKGIVYLYEFRTECWQTLQETRIGKFIRQADLYRLPRLANVLLGEVRAGERVQPVQA